MLNFDFLEKGLGLRLYPYKPVKYLSIKIDESLTWNEHINDIAIKINQANAMVLHKVKDLVKIRILKSIYQASTGSR